MRIPSLVAAAASLSFILLVAVTLVHAADGTQSIGACTSIDKPGPYVLVRNLQATGDCLVVNTSFVTIDLAGYTISGNGTGSGITSGVSNPSGITVRNGTITNFQFGVALGSVGHIIERIRAVNNTDTGISVGLPDGTAGDTVVRDSIASENKKNGIFLLEVSHTPGGAGGLTVIGNIANSNGGIGILVDCPSAILHNTATLNGINIQEQPGPGVCTRLGNSPAP